MSEAVLITSLLNMLPGRPRQHRMRWHIISTRQPCNMSLKELAYYVPSVMSPELGMHIGDALINIGRPITETRYLDRDLQLTKTMPYLCVITDVCYGFQLNKEFDTAIKIWHFGHDWCRDFDYRMFEHVFIPSCERNTINLKHPDIARSIAASPAYKCCVNNGEIMAFICWFGDVQYMLLAFASKIDSIRNGNNNHPFATVCSIMFNADFMRVIIKQNIEHNILTNPTNILLILEHQN